VASSTACPSNTTPREAGFCCLQVLQRDQPVQPAQHALVERHAGAPQGRAVRPMWPDIGGLHTPVSACNHECRERFATEAPARAVNLRGAA